MIAVDLILPIYNPKGEWADDIIRQFKNLTERLSDKYQPRLILVNDGSSYPLQEGFSEIKIAYPTTLINSYKDNRGKGYALRSGVGISSADYIMYTDHDIPYTYGSMREILDVMADDQAPVVIGHRDEQYYKELPWLRVKVSHYLKTINRFILGLNTDDTQCGLKAFHISAKPTFLSTKTDRFMIDIEFLRRLKKDKIPVKVIDVRSRDNVIMSTLGFRTILSELYSYAKIFLTT